MPTTEISKTQLDRLHEVMAGHVERGDMSGLVTLVSRHGEVHVDAIGRLAFDGSPMARDTIFRITSMTKPITAVAAMILVEDGKLKLDEPVDRWLPEICRSQGAAHHRFVDPSNGAGQTRDHAPRSSDVPVRLWDDPRIPRSLSHTAGDCRGRTCAGAGVSILPARRIDAAIWQPAADLSAGRTLAL